VFCRLDQILLTFGSLAIYYHNIKTTDSANILGATAILESIEKRWAKVDQDVFIAAVLLNPFVKASPFSPQVPFLTRAGVLSLMKRLYLCFFSVTETTNELSEHTQQLFSNLEDYLGGRGICAEMTQYIDAISEETRHTGISPDPVMVYHGISPIVAGSLPPLFKLACHVLSICPKLAASANYGLSAQ
jgi:hypothetical protein